MPDSNRGGKPVCSHDWKSAKESACASAAMRPKDYEMGISNKNKHGMNGILGNALILGDSQVEGRSWRRSEFDSPEEKAQKTQDWIESPEFLLLMGHLHRQRNGW